MTQSNPLLVRDPPVGKRRPRLFETKRQWFKHLEKGRKGGKQPVAPCCCYAAAADGGEKKKKRCVENSKGICCVIAEKTSSSTVICSEKALGVFPLLSSCLPCSLSLFLFFAPTPLSWQLLIGASTEGQACRCLSISFIWAGLTCAETWKNTGCLAECNRCVHNVKVKWMKRTRLELKSYLRVTNNFNSHIMQYLLC